MADDSFEIKILDLHWINDKKDDPNDKCAHGHVYLRIGTDVLSDNTAQSWTVSSTALYLLRTLTDNYEPGDFGSQLLPCCGHYMIIEENTNKVLIFGCPNGIDWTIVHEGDIVKLVTLSGTVALIDRDAYKDIVYEFADQVEKFYQSSSPKNIPTYDLDKIAYGEFWNEWRKLRAD